MLTIQQALGGGYINRNTPNLNPAYEGAPSMGSLQTLDGPFGANPSYEYFPARTNITGGFNGMQLSNFMVTTSGLNMYPHSKLSIQSGGVTGSQI